MKEQRIRQWLDKMEILHYTIRENGLVDVDGNVDISAYGLKRIPVRFGVVKGTFDCSLNQLTNLKNTPREVRKLDVQRNQLKTLLGAPIKVDVLDCHKNKLKSLKHCPSHLLELDCSSNQLKSLRHCPEVVEKFNCASNLLTSLAYCPKPTNLFSCSGNMLRKIDFAPKQVFEFCAISVGLKTLENIPQCERLYIYHNQLRSLHGTPASVKILNCSNNQITNLDGLPTQLNSLFCSDNLIDSLEDICLTVREMELKNNPLTLHDVIDNEIHVTGSLRLSLRDDDMLAHQFPCDYQSEKDATWYQKSFHSIREKYRDTIFLHAHLQDMLSCNHVKTQRAKL